MVSKPKVLVTDHIIRNEAISMLEQVAEVKIINGLSSGLTLIEAVKDVDAILAGEENNKSDTICPKLPK